MIQSSTARSMQIAIGECFFDEDFGRYPHHDALRAPRRLGSCRSGGAPGPGEAKHHHVSSFTLQLRLPLALTPALSARLFVDDLGYGDLGFNGHPTTKTENIDKLAYGGKVSTSHTFVFGSASTSTSSSRRRGDGALFASALPSPHPRPRPR